MKPIVSVNIMGGLGNQLFQIASAYAYSKKEGGDFKILFKLDNGNRPVYWNTFLKNVKPYITFSLPTNLEIWREEDATKYSNIGPLNENGKFLLGYLQSSKYFYNDQIKNEIKNLFKQDENDINLVKNKYRYLIDNIDRVIVVHARRTDYLKAADVHNPLKYDYYIEAITKMLKIVNNPIFVFSSDDNSYWEGLFNLYPQLHNYEKHIIENETDINTLILLQQFKYFIMANSTFIWWCVWLADDVKKVIAPSKWFGPAGPREYENIYEESWERI